MKKERHWGVVVALLMWVTTGVPAAAVGDESGAAGDTMKTFEVTAERFSFSPSEIEVTQGDTVRLTIRAIDVTHGFAIADLGINARVGPGDEPVTVEFVAETPGRYPFTCSVFCGAGHGEMRGVLTVVAADGRSPGSGPDRVDELEVDIVEPDFSLITLPTTLRPPRNEFAFRLTHRFSRPLAGGRAHGNFLEDFFGFDSPALIGLELRYGVAPGGQVGIYRGNNKNIQIFGRYNMLWQGAEPGIGLDAFVSVEGGNNFREEYSPTFGAVFSRRVRDRAAVYLEPMWVGNANKPGLLHQAPTAGDSEDDDTFMVGIGTRIRALETVYATLEYVPRTGFDQGNDHFAVAVEKRVGGHIFQVNFSNGLGATPVQLAQGASNGDWYIGFNITRKFY